MMMSVVDSISSIAMDTLITMIFLFDWSADVTESVTELVIVLMDMEDKFVAAISGIKVMVGSDPKKFNVVFSYAAYDMYMDSYM